MEQLELILNLSSSYWDAAPKTRVFINDLLIFEGTITEPQKVKWVGDIQAGKNVLAIELFDKGKNQTVMQNDVIVKDQLLNIDGVSFDNIALGFLNHSLSNYYPDQNYYSNSVPDVVKMCVNLGYNGRWELEFTSPVYIWLLENI